MIRSLIVSILIVVCLASATDAQPIQVVATNSDILAITTEIGGSLVNVGLLLPSGMEPHSLPLRPSLIQKIRTARLLITIGLDHEPWLSGAVSSSGNTRVIPGGAGFVDCSGGVTLLDVPVGPVDRSRGDLHVFGNTHYWLDPTNVEKMVVHITHGLSRELPAKEQEIRERARAFLRDLKKRETEWRQRLSAIKGRKVVSYHSSFPYLAAFTGLEIVGTIELKPGIEPTPAHLAQLRETMKREGVHHILMEPWYNRQRASSLASDTGGKVIVIPPSTPEGKRIGDHIDSIVTLLVENMR